MGKPEAMEFFCVTLNIVDSQPVWDRMAKLYETMPGWQGFQNGCPLWQWGQGWRIGGSVEPGGLQLSGNLPPDEGEVWLERFRREASTLLGYAVGEPAEGFEVPENWNL